MKIPKKIKIGAHVYKVRFEEGMVQHNNLYAQSRHVSTEILLDSKLSQSQLEDSFIHEILHCIDQQVIFTEKDKDEDAIRRLAPMVLAVLKENKLLK